MDTILNSSLEQPIKVKAQKVEEGLRTPTSKMEKQSSFLSFLYSPKLNPRGMPIGQNAPYKPFSKGKLQKKGSAGNYSISTTGVSPMFSPMTPLDFRSKDIGKSKNKNLTQYTGKSKPIPRLASGIVERNDAPLPIIKDDENEYNGSSFGEIKSKKMVKSQSLDGESGTCSPVRKKIELVESFNGSDDDSSVDTCSNLEFDMMESNKIIPKKLGDIEGEEEYGLEDDQLVEFGLQADNNSSSSCSMQEDITNVVMPSPNFKPIELLQKNNNYCDSLRKIMKEKEEKRRREIEAKKTQYGDGKDREKIEDTEFIRFKAPQEKELKPVSMCLPKILFKAEKLSGPKKSHNPTSFIFTKSTNILTGDLQEDEIDEFNSAQDDECCVICQKEIRNKQIVTCFEVCEHKYHENCLLELVTFPNRHNYKEEVLFCPKCTCPRDNQLDHKNNASSVLSFKK